MKKPESVLLRKFERFLVDENGKLYYIYKRRIRFDVTFLSLFIYHIYIYIYDNCLLRYIYSKEDNRRF